jgi:hypothetical protein
VANSGIVRRHIVYARDAKTSLSHTPPLPLPQSWTGEPYWDPLGGGGVTKRQANRQAAMGADMDSGTTGSSLGSLNDPEFIAHWSALRAELMVTGLNDPRYWELMTSFADVQSEYRRRLRVAA